MEVADKHPLKVSESLYSGHACSSAMASFSTGVVAVAVFAFGMLDSVFIGLVSVEVCGWLD